MSNLLDLSAKVDPLFPGLFATLGEVSGSMGVPFFVVGATARDLILGLGYGLPGRRATMDVDLGIRVAGWDVFQKLKQSLIATRQFTQTQLAHRLKYREELLVDILPFGEIANAKGEIRWPPGEDVVMSMVGFEDAYRAALRVRVRAHPPLDILVASTPGLTILKLVAWADRPPERDRDAVDLAHILESYLDAGNYARLLEAHVDLVEVENFDYVRAGARLLGRDVASMGEPKTIERIREILARETADNGRPGVFPMKCGKNPSMT
jgi:predicted nucleotidyltransferase